MWAVQVEMAFSRPPRVGLSIARMTVYYKQEDEPVDCRVGNQELKGKGVLQRSSVRTWGFAVETVTMLGPQKGRGSSREICNDGGRKPLPRRPR